MDRKVMTEFQLFQRYFKEYQKRFGLSGYKVYFKYEPLDAGFADIRINQVSMVATVRLNSKLPSKDKPFKDIKQTSKHEAIHLLLGKLEHLSRERYVEPDSIYEAIEEIVFKLAELING